MIAHANIGATKQIEYEIANSYKGDNIAYWGKDRWLTCNILDRDSHDAFARFLAQDGLVKLSSYRDSKSIIHFSPVLKGFFK